MKHMPTLRRLTLTAVAASAVAMAIGGVSIARAGGHHASDHMMTLKEVQTASTFVNISHSQNGKPGDEAIFKSKLFSHDGHEVGTLDVVCTLVFGGKVECTGTFTLPGGTVTGTALVPSNTTPVHIAITGDTGRYSLVRGQATSTPVSGTVSRDVFDLNY